jgi:hypothetical protein
MLSSYNQRNAPNDSNMQKNARLPMAPVPTRPKKL